MPELPEVHHFQQYFNRHALGKKVRELIVHDTKILRNISGEDFARKSAGLTFTGSYRRGKYLFAHLDNGHHVQLHFGMTGNLAAYSDPAEAPRFERFAWYFEDGTYLGYPCSRKFSRICWIENLENWIKETGLGPDALVISKDDFLKILTKRSTGIKALLLDQKALAGVGNLYADEICYQTLVHPASKSNAIPPQKQTAIYDAMQDILRTACERGADYQNYPENWFWAWRNDNAITPTGEGKIMHATIAGRTTYWWDGQVMYEF
jgi:formamidopyrimidine-DNA glycosylase